MKLEILLKSKRVLERTLEFARTYPELLSRSLENNMLTELARIEEKISKKLKEGRDVRD